MLCTPPHPAEQADRTERLPATIRVALSPPHRPGAGHRRPRLSRVLRGHPRLRHRDRRLPTLPGLVGAAAGRLLHHRRQPGHPLALPTRRRLARPLVRPDPGGLRHRRLGGLERRPRPRPHQRPAVRRPPTRGAAGGAGAADERGPHRPPAHRPHHERGGRQRRPRRHCGQPQQRRSRRCGGRQSRSPAAAAAPDRSAAAGNGSGPPPDSRTRVRELVARERATGTRLPAREVAAAAGISERRAYELLRAVRAEDQQP
jgi:hypothetical protein